MRTALALASLAFVSLAAAPAPAGDPPKGRPDIYDTAADGPKQVEAAIVRAKAENKRVLIQWGANWCGWCHLLHDLFKSDKDIAKELLYEYEVVLVDLGRMDKNMDLAGKLGASFEGAGIPFLTVLDGDGKALVQQATGPLENGDKHDPAKVLAFLKQHAAAPLDAEAVLAGALEQAKAQQKVAFVRFGAPWCGWCHKLDEWIAKPEVAAHLATRAVAAKIDIERMKNGAAVIGRFRAKDGGIPWFAFLDTEGKAIATSDVGGANLGFPATDAEVAAFGKLLDSAGFAAAERDALVESLAPKK